MDTKAMRNAKGANTYVKTEQARCLVLNIMPDGEYVYSGDSELIAEHKTLRQQLGKAMKAFEAIRKIDIAECERYVRKADDIACIALAEIKEGVGYDK